MSEDLRLPPEFWKRLFTPELAAELGRLQTVHGGDLLIRGELDEWKKQHWATYWSAVFDTFRTYFPKKLSKQSHDANDERSIYRYALAEVIEDRLTKVKRRLVLPLYTKELRKAVFSWFQLTAPAFYVVRRSRPALFHWPFLTGTTRSQTWPTGTG